MPRRHGWPVTFGRHPVLSELLTSHQRPGHPPYEIAPDDPRLPATSEWVAGRLRRVCATMPGDAFAALVRDVAAFHLRWLGTADGADGVEGGERRENVQEPAGHRAGAASVTIE